MRGKYRKGKTWQRPVSTGVGRVPVDRNRLKLADWSWGYGIVGGHYVDRSFTCIDCKASATWTAADKKTYFERWGHIYCEQIPRRCAKCRAIRRRAIRENNLRTAQGLQNQPPEKQKRLLPKALDPEILHQSQAR
jgi:hypothetical protein